MNAVMCKYEQTEGADMVAGENGNLAMHVVEARADVRYIRADIAEIRAEQRAIYQRIDSLRKEIEEKLEKVVQRFERSR